MPGVDLFDLICYFTIGVTAVSFHLRLMVIFQLLDAYKKEVLEESIVHGDLKPENFIIDIGGNNVTDLLERGALIDPNFRPTWPIHVIDYEGAYKFGSSRPIISHSGQYLAPEIRAFIQQYKVRPSVSNGAEDMFALGKVIAVILGLVPNETANIRETDFLAKKLKEAKALYPNEPEDFSNSILVYAFFALGFLADPDPSSRWSFNQAYDFFERIRANYNALHRVKENQCDDQSVVHNGEFLQNETNRCGL